MSQLIEIPSPPSEKSRGEVKRFVYAGLTWRIKKDRREESYALEYRNNQQRNFLHYDDCPTVEAAVAKAQERDFR